MVPAYNARRELSFCLEALGASRFRDFEVLVVDDCSTDSPEELVRSYGANYLRTPRQLGPAGARNLGAEHARGSILVFIDSDVAISSDTLAFIAADFELDPDLAAVFGSYDLSPAAPGFFSQYKNLTHHYVHQNSNTQAVTFWAGCGAIRAEIFRRFGFNPDKYPHPSIEDIELGLRLRRNGQTIRLDKRVQVKHLKRWSFVSMAKSDIWSRAVPWTKLILESGEMPADLNLTQKARASAAMTMLLLASGLLAIGSIWLGKVPIALAALGGVGSIVTLIALNHPLYRFSGESAGLGS